MAHSPFARRTWIVVGGAGQGGIVVQEGQELQSCPMRDLLPVGILVQELGRVGYRLCYSNSSGTGPRGGWVSIQLNGKDMLTLHSASQPPRELKRSEQALFQAAHIGNVFMVKQSLIAGARVEAMQRAGKRYVAPLHVAAMVGAAGVARLLIRRSDTVDVRTIACQPLGGASVVCGETPLHIAARSGHVVVAEMLLRARACIEAKSTQGATPLGCAAEHSRVAAVELLLARGASVEEPNIFGSRPLHLAAAVGHSSNVTQTIQHLIQARADLSAANENGHTALALASKHSRVCMASSLLTCAEADSGRTPAGGAWPPGRVSARPADEDGGQDAQAPWDGEVWVEHWSEQWHCTCYYNKETGEMVWTLDSIREPAACAAAAEPALGPTSLGAPTVSGPALPPGPPAYATVDMCSEHSSWDQDDSDEIIEMFLAAWHDLGDGAQHFYIGDMEQPEGQELGWPHPLAAGGAEEAGGHELDWPHPLAVGSMERAGGHELCVA